MKNNPLVSIIILNWNGKEITDRCLDTLLKRTKFEKERFHVLVIDNGSNDGSSDYLDTKYGDRIELIRLTSNLGFINGNNLGIEYVMNKYDPDYILLLNNDIEIIQDDWLQKLTDTAEENKNVGLVGPKLIFPNGRIQWSGWRLEKNPIFLILQTTTARMNPGFGEFADDSIIANFVGEVNTISGACMLINKKLIENIGLLDSSLYPMYQEDVEYSFRAWKNGYQVLYRGDVSLVHKESETIQKYKGELEYKKLFWAVRNSMIVSKRYFGFLKTFLLGMPIFIFITLFDKRQKSKKLNIYNLKFADNFDYRLYILLKSMYHGLFRTNEVMGVNND